jgi:DNA end-binding protein Ku
MISFGLVSVPVVLYPAEQSHQLAFSMLDKHDFSPIGYKRYNKTTGKEVAWNDIVKGYEYEKDQFVVLSEEDFRRANVQQARSVDIATFVDADSIPPQYFDTPYYLVPGERGQKVYALLRETLRATKRIAVAQVVLRTKQTLAAVTVNGKMLMMNTLRYPDELRDTQGLDVPSENLKAAGVTPKEIELAKRLIEDMSEKWKPEEFHNTYHEDLMARINEKIESGETHEITKPESGEKEERPSAKVIDLAELQKASLGRGTSAKKKGAKAEAANDEDSEEEAPAKHSTRRKAANAAAPVAAKSTKPPLSAVAAKKRAPAKRKSA